MQLIVSNHRQRITVSIIMLLLWLPYMSLMCYITRPFCILELYSILCHMAQSFVQGKLGSGLNTVEIKSHSKITYVKLTEREWLI